MTKVTLANVANLQDTTTAQNTINANSAAIVAAVENTLSRDGTSPNKMSANLDMDSNRILNLPLAATADEPVRSIDIQNLAIGTLPNITTTGNITAGGNITATGAVNGSMSAASLKGNPTNIAAVSQDIQIQGLTARGAPDAANDKMIIYDNAAGTLKYVTPSQVASVLVSGVTSLNGSTGVLALQTAPGGRLTLTTNTPVMTTSVSAAGTVYYTPYCSEQVPIFDGTNWIPTVFTEKSNILANSAVGNAGPAATIANSCYDLFMWNNAGTITLTRGPAWTDLSNRSMAIALVHGFWVNAAGITNGPANQRGTYVGTICTNAANLVDYIFGDVGAGGIASYLLLWNAYNRVPVKTMVQDSTASWTYAVANTWRIANGSSNNQVRIVRGLNEDGVTATYNAMGTPGAGTIMYSGIGLDSVANFSGTTGVWNGTGFVNMPAIWSGQLNIGLHIISAIELNTTVTASTWIGYVANVRSPGLIVETWQ